MFLTINTWYAVSDLGGVLIQFKRLLRTRVNAREWVRRVGRKLKNECGLCRELGELDETYPEVAEEVSESVSTWRLK